MSFAGVGGELDGLDTVDRAGLVSVRKVATDTDGTDYRAAGIPDEDATGNGDQRAAGQGDDSVEELRVTVRSVSQRPGAYPHVQSAGGLPPSDLFAEQTRSVLATESHQVAARIQHRNRHRRILMLFGEINCAGNDLDGLTVGDHHASTVAASTRPVTATTAASASKSG